jgi:hypothetical protein
VSNVSSTDADTIDGQEPSALSVDHAATANSAADADTVDGQHAADLGRSNSEIRSVVNNAMTTISVNASGNSDTTVTLGNNVVWSAHTTNGGTNLNDNGGTIHIIDRERSGSTQTATIRNEYSADKTVVFTVFDP